MTSQTISIKNFYQASTQQNCKKNNCADIQKYKIAKRMDRYVKKSINMLSDNKQKTDGNKMARTQRRRVLGGNWVLGGCLWGVEEMGGNGRCLCVGFPDGGTCPSSHSCCSATRDHLQNHLKRLFSWYILEQFDIVILSTTGSKKRRQELQSKEWGCFQKRVGVPKKKPRIAER